jgi:hypothetical protein
MRGSADATCARALVPSRLLGRVTGAYSICMAFMVFIGLHTSKSSLKWLPATHGHTRHAHGQTRMRQLAPTARLVVAHMHSGCTRTDELGRRLCTCFARVRRRRARDLRQHALCQLRAQRLPSRGAHLNQHSLHGGGCFGAHVGRAPRLLLRVALDCERAEQKAPRPRTRIGGRRGMHAKKVACGGSEDRGDERGGGAAEGCRGGGAVCF